VTIGRTVTAFDASVAVGGDLVDSNVTIGTSSEELQSAIEAATRQLIEHTERQQSTIDTIRERIGVTEAALGAFFIILGEAAVPPEELGRRLVEIATRYKKLERDIAAVPGDDVGVAALRLAAKSALEEGALDRAHELLMQIMVLQENAIERRRVEAAATLAQIGQLSVVRLRYLEAAGYFAAAAQRLPDGYEDIRRAYRADEAAAYSSHGDEFGDNDSLRKAIDRRRTALAVLPLHGASSLRADAATDLGNALLMLGERQSGTTELEEAIGAYEAALAQLEQVPSALKRARVHNNLGSAWLTLGRRRGDTGNLEKAVEAFGLALETWTFESNQIDWAMAKNNLGGGLSLLAERQNDAASWQPAIEAYRAALTGWTRELVPLKWAMVQNNLGVALKNLGIVNGGTSELEESVAAFRSALQVWTQKRVPLKWASGGA
jgi:tetratricopeptide (TPR) repeat protein